MIDFKSYIEEGAVRIPDEAYDQIEPIVQKYKERVYPLVDEYHKLIKDPNKNHDKLHSFWDNLRINNGFNNFNPDKHLIGGFNVRDPYTNKQVRIPIFLSAESGSAYAVNILRKDKNHLPEEYKNSRFGIMLCFPGILEAGNIRNVLFHELTHIMDPKVKKTATYISRYGKLPPHYSHFRHDKTKYSDPNKEYDAYLKSPVEIDAFLRETISYIKRKLDGMNEINRKKTVSELKQSIRDPVFLIRDISSLIFNDPHVLDVYLKKPTLVKRIINTMYKFLSEYDIVKEAVEHNIFIYDIIIKTDNGVVKEGEVAAYNINTALAIAKERYPNSNVSVRYNVDRTTKVNKIKKTRRPKEDLSKIHNQMNQVVPGSWD